MPKSTQKCDYELQMFCSSSCCKCTIWSSIWICTSEYSWGKSVCHVLWRKKLQIWKSKTLEDRAPGYWRTLLQLVGDIHMHNFVCNNIYDPSEKHTRKTLKCSVLIFILASNITEMKLLLKWTFAKLNYGYCKCCSGILVKSVLNFRVTKNILAMSRPNTELIRKHKIIEQFKR